MTDRRDAPLETTGGWQPSSSGGERLIVGLAVIALVGAALIVAGNLLHHEDGVSVASGSPRPTAAASPTPTQVPTPMEVALQPASIAPTPRPVSSGFSGWIRANTSLPIRSYRSDVASVVGTLAAGSVTPAYEDTSVAPADDHAWLHIGEPDPVGWVATRPGGADLVTRYAPDPVPYPGSFQTIAAGTHGFLALGTQAGRSDSPAEPEVFVSLDGAVWEPAPVQPSPICCSTLAAWGPAGWLLVGTPEGGDPKIWFWRSPDGRQWGQPLEFASDAPTNTYPIEFQASNAGYVLITSKGGGRGGFGAADTIWFSTDGATWTESKAGQTPSDELFLAAVRQGFYVWSDPRMSVYAKGVAAFSADGRSWSPVTGGPDSSSAQLVTIGDRLLALETDPDNGSLRAWIGSFEGANLTWSAMPGASAPFLNAHMTSLASDGHHAVAFGWDQATEAPLTWTSDGGPWTRAELPTSFAGIPSPATGGDRGVIVVGHRLNARGDNPVIWHRNEAGHWVQESSAILGLAPDPTQADCRELPTDAVSFITRDTVTLLTCFGSTPITFRAWATACAACGGGQGGTYVAAWLAAPTDLLSLSPEANGSTWSFVLSPALARGQHPEWSGAWVEVTGHFDDPAAPTCHWSPPATRLQQYLGAQSIVEACRQQFVITAVKVVDGP